MALIALCAVTTPVTFATTVYRWTAADGVVHFSDQPVPGAEKITIGPAKLYDTPKVATPAQPPRRAPDAPKPSQPHLGYTSIAVTAPTAEKTYFEESVPVALTLVPALRDGAGREGRIVCVQPSGSRCVYAVCDDHRDQHTGIDKQPGGELLRAANVGPVAAIPQEVIPGARRRGEKPHGS
jgi:hypothetical protein